MGVNGIGRKARIIAEDRNADAGPEAACGMGAGEKVGYGDTKLPGYRDSSGPGG